MIGYGRRTEVTYTIRVGEQYFGEYESEREGWDFLRGQGWEMQHISGIWSPKDRTLRGAAIVVPVPVIEPESEFPEPVSRGLHLGRLMA